MAKIRDLLHSRPKVDEEELAAESRAAARLADLAERRNAAPAEGPSATGPSPDVVEDGEIATSTPGDPGPRPAERRPPIVVQGDADVVGIDRENSQVVDVMARLREDMRDDGWQMALVGGLVPAVRRRDVAPVEAPLTPDPLPDVVEEGGRTSSVLADLGPWPGDPRPPIIVEGDAEVVDVDRENSQVVDVMAELHDAGGDGRSMPLGEGGVPPVARSIGAGRPIAAKLLPRQAGQLLGRAPHDRARGQHSSRIRAPVPGLLSILRPAPAARAGVESTLCPLPSADHREAHRRASGLPD